MKRKEKNNFIRNTFIFVLILVVLCLFAIQISYKMDIVEVRFVEMSVNISDSGFGFNNSEDSLNFGKLTKGDTSKRIIVLSQNSYEELNVVIKTYGDISRFVYVQENSFTLKKGEIKEIGFVLKVPENEGIGRYDGYAKIILTK